MTQGMCMNQNTFFIFYTTLGFFWSVLNLMLPWRVYLLLDDLQLQSNLTISNILLFKLKPVSPPGFFSRLLSPVFLSPFPLKGLK